MDEKLLNSLAKLGFPMFETKEDLAVNETLAEVIKSDDTRLWEGFPVLLANADESYQFSIEVVTKLLKNKQEKDIFHMLLLLSGALFSYYNISFAWWNRLQKDLSEIDRLFVKRWKNDLLKFH